MEANEFTLMQKLIDCASNNSLDNIFGNIAYYLLLNFNKVDTLSSAELADVCFTSPSTIRRFCNSIGYQSFTNLKNAKAGNPEDQKQISIHNAVKGRFSAKYMQTHINESLYSIARSVSDGHLDRLVDIILSKQNLLLLAIRPYALWLKEFQSQMLFLGFPTYIIDDLEHYDSLFARVSKNYSCLVVSPTGGIADAISPHIGQLDCQKALIVCRDYNNPQFLGQSQQCYDYVLQLNNPTVDIDFMELFGKYGIGYLFDLIYGKIVERKFLPNGRSSP